MIHHLSIAARDPQHAAGVLAELMGGKSVPFPPNPGSFFALQLDDHGSGVEVYPAGTELAPNGSTGGTFVKQPQHRGFGPTHFALSVPTDADKVRRSPPRPDGSAIAATADPSTSSRCGSKTRRWSRSCRPTTRPNTSPSPGPTRYWPRWKRRRSPPAGTSASNRSQREANESNAPHHCARPGCRCRLRRQRYRRTGGG